MAHFCFKQFKNESFTMTNDELQSKTIAFLRFPLIVGVVLIHCYYKELPIGGVKVPVMDEYPIYKLIADLFSQVLARTAVPLFFLISGYLFFYKSSLSWPMYGSKLRKRAQTLLFPYLFWNGALVALHLLMELLFPSALSGETKPVLITDGVIGGISFGRENLVSREECRCRSTIRCGLSVI